MIDSTTVQEQGYLKSTFEVVQRRHLLDVTQLTAKGEIISPFNDFISDEELNKMLNEAHPYGPSVITTPTESCARHTADDSIVVSTNDQDSSGTHLGVSEARVVMVAQPPARVMIECGDGVWEPLKASVQAKIYRVAPEEYRLDDVDVDKQEEMVPTPEEVYQGVRMTVLPRPILFWLESLNEMTSADAELEASTVHGKQLLVEIKNALIVDGGLSSSVADELESLNYQVSYDRNTGTLLLELSSGAIRWAAS